MKKERVLKAMREIAATEVSTEIDLWPRLEQQLASKHHAPGRRAARLAPRLSWAAAILALLLLMGTVAYATSPAFRALLAMDPGLQDVAAVDGRPLGLSQTVNGVTVTLDWAYADANRIAVAYSIDAPGTEARTRRYEGTDRALRNEAGTVFEETMTIGVSGASDMLGVTLPPGKSATVASFDATALKGSPEALALQFQLNVEAFEVTAETVQVTAEVAEDVEAPAAAEVVHLEPLAGERTLIGPFTFHFNLPFNPAHRVMNKAMTVTAKGITVTLDRLLVTPSEMTAVLCFESPNETYVEWLPISEVAVQREVAYGGAFAQTPSERGACTVNRYEPSFYEANGSWTLTVTELVGWTADGRSQTRIEGPWVFEFTVVP